MADSTTKTPQVCGRFHRAIELIGSRWTGAILQTLLQGRTRYAVVKGAIPDITDRMLSERLRSLEAEDLVARTVIPESPVRVEYEWVNVGQLSELPAGSIVSQESLLAAGAIKNEKQPLKILGQLHREPHIVFIRGRSQFRHAEMRQHAERAAGNFAFANTRDDRNAHP